MTKKMAEQIGLYKLKLAQKRYGNGAFYLSVILNEGQIKAVDARFILEEGAYLTPTKNGFRLPIDKLKDFKKALNQDLRDIGDIVLFENKSFSFHIRYINDKYGEGIDFRKYRTTERYTGWDRSGIRMKLEDVSSMLKWFQPFDHKNISFSNDLFAGKNFGPTGGDNQKNSENTGLDVNPVIMNILDY